jgi:hypothetical protein
LKRKSLHQEIVEETLPRFAEHLQQEDVISGYNRKSFKIKSKESFPPFVIKPDLVLVLADKKRFLVEVVNPRDPKRLMGELACVQLLGFHNLIDAALVFLLPLGPEHVNAPAKGVRLFQGGQIINDVIGSKVPSVIVSWSTREDFNYHNLKQFILNRRPSWWGIKNNST